MSNRFLDVLSVPCTWSACTHFLAKCGIYPAHLLSLDSTQANRELEWEWIPEIAWPTPGRHTSTFRRRLAASEFHTLDANQVCCPVNSTLHYIQLIFTQIGKICAPLDMQPRETESTITNDDVAFLKKIETAMDGLAEILATFHTSNKLGAIHSNPVLANWCEYMTEILTVKKHAAAIDWISSLPISRNPRIDNLLTSPLADLLRHPGLSHLHFADAMPLASGPGMVLMHLAAIQHELDEPIIFDGALLSELKAGSVFPVYSNIEETLHVMWSAIDPLHLSQSRAWSADQLAQSQCTFNEDHIVYEAGPAHQYQRACPVTMVATADSGPTRKRKMMGKESAETQPLRRSTHPRRELS